MGRPTPDGLSVGAAGSDEPAWWEAVLRPSVGGAHAQHLARAPDRRAAATALGERIATRVATLERDIGELRRHTRLPMTVLGSWPSVSQVSPVKS